MSHETSFPLWILFISCSIAAARTHNTMLNRSDRSGHPCLVTYFREKKNIFQLFIIEYDVSCGFVINDLYSIEICFLYTNSNESLYHGWMGGRAGNEWARVRARYEPHALLCFAAMALWLEIGASSKVLELKSLGSGPSWHYSFKVCCPWQ